MVIAALSLGIFLLILFLFVIVPILENIDIDTEYDLEEIEKYLGTELPTDAQNIHYSSSTFQEVSIYLVFNASPNNLENFLKHFCFDMPLNEQYNPFDNSVDSHYTTSWWTPLSVERYSGGTCNNKGNLYKVLIDKTDPVDQKLYLYVFG